MHKRGGFRPGAGRPAVDPSERRRPLSTTISYLTWQRLRAYALERGLKLGEALDELLEKSLAGLEQIVTAEPVQPIPLEAPIEPD